jgi:hypothetical protein
MTRPLWNRLLFSCLLAGGGALLPVASFATDGSSPPPPPSGGDGASAPLQASPPTYYESAVGETSTESLESADPTLPATLAIDDATATTRYQATSQTATSTEWQLRIDGFDRRHERVDGIYDMVLVIPLPASESGGDAFQATKRGFFVEEGGLDATVPLIYGGEKVVLKRNVGLEKSLLRQLVGPSGLPDLAGTGFRWTAWDSIMRRDATYQDTVQATGHLEYTTAAGIAAPSPDDARMAAYLITWIPGLPADIAPFTVRMDVVPPSP